jgi:hypothetical protein
LHRDIRRCFADARRLSAGTHGERRVVIIAPDGTLVLVPVPSPEKADRSLLRDVRAALAPQHEPVTGLVITAINATAGVQRRGRSFFKLLPLVPNLSYLVGAACLGNTVVAFEGHANDFAAGCEGADVLLLDDGMTPLLRPDWAALALNLLRQPRILEFCRDGRLRKVDQVVEVERPEMKEEG